MSVRSIFRGRNIVLTLLAILLYLVVTSLQTADSTLSQILQPKNTPTPSVAVTFPEDGFIEENETNDASGSSQTVEGTAIARQVAQVVKVIDGDTIDVRYDNKNEKIRIIGIDTPETVDPRTGVECFGREASNFAKQTLNGKTVYLEFDPSQAERDRYGRLLRFVFLSDETDFGKLMIREGYAHEYTYDLPYRYQTAYKEAERQAREAKKGLWSDICK